MNKMALIAAFIASQSWPVMAQEQPTALYQGQMDQIDGNSDGAVDRSEYQAFMIKAFDGLDKDRNGSLRSDEVKQILTAEQFRLSDTDGDGRVGESEFMKRVLADLSAADRSGDGSLR